MISQEYATREGTVCRIRALFIELVHDSERAAQTVHRKTLTAAILTVFVRSMSDAQLTDLYIELERLEDY